MSNLLRNLYKNGYDEKLHALTVTGKEFDTSKLERLGLSEIQTKRYVSFIRFSKI